MTRVLFSKKITHEYESYNLIKANDDLDFIINYKMQILSCSKQLAARLSQACRRLVTSLQKAC